ncbi:MAG: carboxypeptidase regulatory-like domain-containing protein [Oscillospiraceae bacterium]|nr:carboxypeptidase regulatory-like domain-containing protein [Oscillospiraceae bacterium]
MKKMRKFLSAALAAVISSSMLLSASPVSVSAADGPDPVVVVSLGDSYSSGEGIPPFYNQSMPIEQRVVDLDWVAHRSEDSWPSQIVIPGVSGTMKDYDQKDADKQGSGACRWYFTAVSGAETKHFDKEEQEKAGKDNDGNWNIYKKKESGGGYWYVESLKMPLQLSVFNDIPEGTVDFVTMSVGGNDVNFVDIVTTCAKASTHIHFINDDNKKIKQKMNELWANFDDSSKTTDTKRNIKRVYKAVAEKAGPQATVIVAGYPKLFDKTGKGFLISEEEATIVNNNVVKFNGKLQSLVEECRKEGYNMYFVDVVDEFEGHEAYTHSKKKSEDGQWINHIMLGAEPQDLSDKAGVSAYSMHPNEYGAKHYAKRVNEEIAALGTLSGKVVKAEDRTTPIKNANVTIYKDGSKYTTAKTNEYGQYQLRLPEGDYKVEITAEGYLDFEAYASITRQTVNYMETFLLIDGTEEGTGTAKGTVLDGLTGRGVADVSLTIRKGWNTPDSNTVVKTLKTNSDGTYSVDLPYGNYTVYASKDGYIATSFNIISKKTLTSGQNGTISSAVLGDGYRMILTWGEYPEDLDSHVRGLTSDGYTFHVYFNDMYAYDGNAKLCDLDVDDVTSYGPETITLQPTSTSAYYYYVYKYYGTQGTVASSGAKIKVYKGDSLIRTFNVPTNLGDGDYWNVFAIKNGQLIVRNTITDYAETSYAD